MDINTKEANRKRGFINCLRICGAVETKMQFFSQTFMTGNINRIDPNKINIITPIVEITAPVFSI